MDNNSQKPSSGMPRRQFVDGVVRPGRTPASPTSRPVVPSNRPAVHDTSMKPSGAPAVPAGLLNSQQKAAPQQQPVTLPRQPAMPAQKAAGAAPHPTPFRPQPRPAALPQQPQQDVGKTAVDDQMASEEQMNGQQQFSDARPQQEDHHEGRHSILSEVLAILAIILLIAIIINILADAEIINLPIPHTNFFDY